VTLTGASLGGADAANYVLDSVAPALANITALGVTVVSGLTADNKVYDATTVATIRSNNVVLSGVLVEDSANVSLETNNYTAAFDSPSVGVGKPVTVGGLTLTGSAAQNYAFAQPILTADITKAVLVISADDKSRAYGMNNPVLTARYSGFAGAETLATSGVTGEPSLSTTATNTSPAGEYSIVAAMGSLSAGNYSFAFGNGTLVIIGGPPSITSITVDDPTHVVIRWSAIPNVTYRVQYRADFSTDWVDLAPDVTAVGDTASMVDNSALETRRFYRLMVLP
jgi:hypothetical protein